MRKDSDLLGELWLPDDVYYGAQTLRALQMYEQSAEKINCFPSYVFAMAAIKKASAIVNGKIGVLDEERCRALIQACDEMIDMMLAQQCTNKIPLLLPGEGRAAHKTGEDDGTTHDTGIIFAKKPFIVCFVNWQLEEGSEGRMNVQIGQITRELWDAMGGEPQED